jgi:Flp pilus assembly protein TadG
MRRARRLLHGTRGVVTVEFALVVPILLLMVFAIIDFSRAYYTLNQLVSSVREGARYAAVLDNPAAQAESVRQVVEHTMDPFGGQALTDGEIDVTLDSAASSVTVRVHGYPFKLVTPFANIVGLGTVPLTREATFRWERGG